MFLNRATMPIVATFHTLPAPYIAIFVPSTLPTLPVALPVALPTLPGETFSEKTCITSCYRSLKCAVVILHHIRVRVMRLPRVGPKGLGNLNPRTLALAKRP